jgi:hypothetical protein
MNKKILLAGFVVAAGFITLTAFGGQTLEQQKQEIAAAITAQLDEFRGQKQQECTDRINAEAQRRYDEYVAALPPVKATKPGGTKKAAAKKPSAVTPMPQTPPAQSPKQEKMQQTPTNTEGKQEKMMQTPTNTEGKKSKMQKTQEGGGGK